MNFCSPPPQFLDRRRVAQHAIVGTLLTAILLVLIWAGTTPAHAQADTTAPTISSIAITSNPDDDISYPMSRGVYGIDDAIQVTVTFSEEVVVTGTPQVELDLGSSSTRLAEYEGVNGSSVMFGYTVAEGDSATDGLAVAASKLTLNGGSIKDAADNSANLSHDAIARQSSHRVDGIRPELSSLTIAPSGFNADDVFGLEDIVIIFASFSEPTFGSKSPAPQLKLNFDGVEKFATWTNVQWDFYYQIQEGDSDSDGLEIVANSVVLNGGYFRDAAGNDASDLTHPAIAASYRNRVDAAAPAISSVAITSDPGADDTYGTGDQIEVAVTFSENVTVPAITRSDMPGIRHPQLELDIGGEAKTAEYQSHQGSTVVFAYNVQGGDTDEDGISIGANKLVLNGGLIVDITNNQIFDAPVTNNRANLSHDAVAADPNHKVAGTSSPFTLSGDTTVQYLENETWSMNGPFSYYEVSGASGEVTWSLSGADSDDFAIPRHGANKSYLKFASPPNYEAPTDADADNQYRVRIHASDGQNEASLQVTVTVFNIAFDDDEVPVITGTVQVGQTLTADMSLISDADKEAHTFLYFWFRSDDTADDIWDTEIDGANSSSYTLTTADTGKSITVAGYSTRWPRVSGVSTRFSAPTGPVAAASTQQSQQTNSPASGQPTISGTAQVGETLTAETSGISDSNGLANATFSYQWLADDADTSGATGSAYTLASADEGKAVKVRVTFTDDAGFGETLTSAATAAVAAAAPTDPPPAPTNSPASGQPTISGTAQVGETLTADTSGISDGNDLTNATFSYQWLADNADISGATGSAYALASADEGKAVKVRVTFTDDAGFGETLTSTATAAVTAAAPPAPTNSPASGQPTISGTAQVGETLTADTSGISDGNDLTNATFSYQWLADDADISGATGSAYTLASADEGKAVKVRVAFTDDAGFGETLTSAATATVAAAAPTDPPPAPTNLEVSDNGDGTLTVTWNAPDDDSVTGYQILRRRPQEGEKTLLVYVEDTGSTATTWIDRDVTLDTRHTYRVKAINAAGLSKMSNHERATPQAPAPPSAPTITGTAIASRPANGDTYVLGETIRITVTFSEAVAVTGSPRLKIDMDPAHWGEKWAVYESGSGARVLTFVHEVVEPNLSTQGIAVLANSLEPNGGSIKSAGSDADAQLAHTGLGHDPAHKVDWQ